MNDTMNRLWRGFCRDGTYSDIAEAEKWFVSLDVVEDEETVVVHASLQ